MTAKRLKRPRDPVQLGKLVGDILTGQVEDRAPTPEDQGKDVRAVERGRLGGMKGGRARADVVSKERPIEISRKAAKTRWSKKAKVPVD